MATVSFEKFMLQLGMGLVWNVIGPQIPFILSVGGFLVAWWAVNYTINLWGGKPNE